tara:strand:- start:282526 stop:282879 length:354 start_codon:yes stop_codon:yes gene_type:complete
MTPSRKGPASVDAGRAVLVAALPQALIDAVETYQAHAGADIPEDARAFQQHQAACKAALQHIEVLLKLQGALGDDVSPPDTEGALDAVRARAEAAYSAYAGAAIDDNDNPSETEIET